MNYQDIENQNNNDDQNGIQIDVQAYWILVKRHLKQIIGFTVASSLIAALTIYSLPSIYQAASTILIEAEDAKVVSIQEVYAVGSARTEYFYTQFEILKSRDLAEKVIKKLDLINNPAFNSKENKDSSLLAGFIEKKPPSEQDIIQSTLSKFSQNLEVRPLRNTQLVQIAFNSTDPVLAADIINTLAQTYIESDLESRLEMTRSAATWLNSRMSGLREQLDKSEQELQDYREKENLIEVEGVRTLPAQELNEITTKLVEARRRRTEAENIVAQARHDTSTVPAVLEHTLVQRLKEQEALADQRLSEISKRYGPLHPKTLAAKSEVDAARSSSGQQVSKVIEGVRREYEIAKSAEQSLEQSLEKMKNEMQGINRKEYKLNELERAVKVNRELYDTFFSRIKETSETESLSSANARVIDKAVAPTVPSKPRRLMLLAIAMMFSFCVGVLLAIIKEMLDSTIKDPEDVRDIIKEQVLGLLPALKGVHSPNDIAMKTVTDPRGTFAESIRTIRTGVILSGIDNPHKVLVVTSSVPGEGKSVTSINLALSFAKMGKTLLIDADMRKPSIAKCFGLQQSLPGLSNLVAGTAEPSECIHHIKDLGLDIIPSGVIPPNPLELLSSKRFAAVMAALGKNYERIIIDSAPSEVVSDGLVLSTFANAVIYVVRADSTHRKVVKSGVSRLRAAGAPLAGIVLNQLDIERSRYYGSHYYAGYYGSDEDTKEKTA